MLGMSWSTHETRNKTFTRIEFEPRERTCFVGEQHLCHHRWNVSSGPAKGPRLRTGGRAGSMTSPAGRGEGTAWPEPGDCLCGPWSHSPGREGWEDTPQLSSPWPSLPGPKKKSVGEPGLSL